MNFKTKKFFIPSLIGIISISLIVFGIYQSNEPNTEKQESQSNNYEELTKENDTSTDDKSPILEDITEEEQNELDNESNSVKETLNTDNFEKYLTNDLGYTFFDEGCYDYLSENKSLAFVEIFDNTVRLSLDDKVNINNINISSVLSYLLPSENDKLLQYINNNDNSLMMSLDNKSVNIDLQNARLILTITNNL